MENQLGIRCIAIPLEPECDHNCIFCQDKVRQPVSLSSDKLRYNSDKLEFIKYRFITFYNHGFKSIYFTGQDALKHPNIFQLIAIARKCLFNPIIVQTPGTRLADMRFVKALIKAGISTFDIPIYGSNEFVHDAITRSRGSFKNLILALDNLTKNNILLRLNTIILNQNYRDIVSLIKLKIKKYPKAYFTIGHYRPHINSIDIYKQFCPRYQDSLGYIKEAAAIFDKEYVFLSAISRAFAAGFASFPCCIAYKIDSEFLKYLGFKERKTSLKQMFCNEQLKDASFKYSIREKLTLCRACQVNKFCLGIHNYYLRAYGQNEFEPISHVRE